MAKPHELIDTLASARTKAIKVLADDGFYKVKDRIIDLEDRIHPLFHHNRFLNLPMDSYQKIKPALWLASLLIEDRRAIDWFLTYMRGIVSPSSTDKGRQYLYVPSGESTNELDIMVQWEATLSKLAQILTWDLYLDEKPHLLPVVGMTCSWKELREDWKRLVVHCESLDELKQKEEWTIYLTVQFYLANVLVHELAHCLYNFPERRPHFKTANFSEVYSNKMEAETAPYDPEIGNSWCVAVIGGKLDFALNSLTRPGSFLNDYTGSSCSLPDFSFRIGRPRSFHHLGLNFPRHYLYELVPLDWIADWFRKSHWAKHKRIVLKKPVIWTLTHEVMREAEDEMQQDVRLRIWKPNSKDK
ncbi:hypothetical protein K491DRAFT_679877 [Lophiostoma macrostomum CBS 122681]|uniref:Uncharacterized protein n=1 Tax=Lophiostoma macrostomum CBS 122681 TaxID=1314788 RepID=A0A6A6T4T2_9PLEO|nr:hypothetical protein K491DRAFT_679877 [Lophiostoma macrostomum CBS 122681]